MKIPIPMQHQNINISVPIEKSTPPIDVYAVDSHQHEQTESLIIFQLLSDMEMNIMNENDIIQAMRYIDHIHQTYLHSVDSHCRRVTNDADDQQIDETHQIIIEVLREYQRLQKGKIFEAAIHKLDISCVYKNPSLAKINEELGQYGTILALKQHIVAMIR
jgi:hypothetical protein